jgi:hypothetical protein
MRAVRPLLVLGLALAAIVIPSSSAFADRANSASHVTHTSALNQTLTDSISTAADQDWYRFTLPSSGRYELRLTNLPANLRLDVYNSHVTALSSSVRPWNQFEEIYRHFDAGTYYVRVASQDGTFSASANYALRFIPLAPGMRVLTVNHFRNGSGLNVLCDVVNNTASWKIVVSLKIELVDASGVVYAHSDGGSQPDVVGPYRHTFCEANFAASLEKRLDHARVVVANYVTTPYRDWPLVVQPSGSHASALLGAVFTGHVRNVGTTRIEYPGATFVFYASTGRVRTLVHWVTGPHYLARGGSAYYSVSSHDVGPHTLFRSFAWAVSPRPTV